MLAGKSCISAVSRLDESSIEHSIANALDVAVPVAFLIFQATSWIFFFFMCSVAEILCVSWGCEFSNHPIMQFFPVVRRVGWMNILWCLSHGIIEFFIILNILSRVCILHM